MMKTTELSTAISQSHETIPLRFHALWYQNIKITKLDSFQAQLSVNFVPDTWKPTNLKSDIQFS